MGTFKNITRVIAIPPNGHFMQEGLDMASFEKGRGRLTVP